MKFFKKTLPTLLFCASLAAAAFGQNADEVLATATDINFTSQALSSEGQRLWRDQAAISGKAKSALFSQMMAEILLETEARSAKTTVDALLEAEMKKLPPPSAAEIKTVFDANRDRLADKTLAEMTPQIIDFLHHRSEEKVMEDMVAALKIKYKVTMGKAVTAADLKPMEMLFSMTGRSVSAQEFEAKNRSALYDVSAEIADEVRSDLEASIFSTLVSEEAKAQNTDQSALIASEITNKMRDFSDSERANLELAFRKKLYTKYNVKILLKEPLPFAQEISADDDPSQGKGTAPVTVIMFSDFQCPACSATHPVLKSVMAEYGDKIRFVVRDFPLESIHDNAFRAALAAYASNAQGKFFEYSDLLYRNQNALDAASLSKYAASLGLNVKQFEIDLSSEKAAAEVRKDMADGRAYGIGGTPTIYVNGVKVRRLTADAFRSAIDNALKK